MPATTAKHFDIALAKAAVQESVRAALQANKDGTFGVGAVLVDNKTGEILKDAKGEPFIVKNGVIKDGVPVDPTAHAERQSVDRYYEQPEEWRQAHPKESFTVVTTLDPCVMCAGCLMKAGFNAVSISMDSYAGIAEDDPKDGFRITDKLKSMARKLFGYFAFEEEKIRNKFVGQKDSPWHDFKFEKDILSEAWNAFISIAGKAREVVNNYRDSAPLEPGQEQRKQVADVIRNAMPAELDGTDIRNADYTGINAWKTPTAFKKAMNKAADESKAAGNSKNSIALLDPFGNVLMIMTGQEKTSPIRTPVQEMVRTYATARATAPEELIQYMPHPKYCSVVFLNQPEKTPDGVIDIGTLGSMYELKGKDKARIYYMHKARGDNGMDATGMAPLYEKVAGIYPEKFTKEAIRATSAAAVMA